MITILKQFNTSLQLAREQHPELNDEHLRDLVLRSIEIGVEERKIKVLERMSRKIKEIDDTLKQIARAGV